MVRLALVGIGGYGRMICRILRRLSQEGRLSLVAAADSRLGGLADSAEELAAEGVELFDNALEMFEKLQGKCEAVSICTGIPSHLPLVQAAARSGLHIHLEKPPASTVQQTDQIIQAVQKAGVMCMLGFHSVHGETMRSIKDTLASGKLGSVKNLTAIGMLPRKRCYYTRNGWAGRLRLGDGWVLDGIATNAMCHEIHSMLFLAGSGPLDYATPVSVRGELYSAWPIEGHDTASLEIRTAEGSTAWFVGSHCTSEKQQPVITIQAENGTARWSDSKATIEYADGATDQCEAKHNAREQMLMDFIETVGSGDASKLVSTPVDGRKVMAVVNGAHDSSGNIHRIPSKHYRKIDRQTDQASIIVSGLDEYMLAADQEHCLLSDLDKSPPWAVATEHIDISDYDSFPRRFRCD